MCAWRKGLWFGVCRLRARQDHFVRAPERFGPGIGGPINADDGEDDDG